MFVHGETASFDTTLSNHVTAHPRRSSMNHTPGRPAESNPPQALPGNVLGFRVWGFGLTATASDPTYNDEG